MADASASATIERRIADPTERVGQIEMGTVPADRSKESDDRWERRADSLAAWLLFEWKRERKEAA